MKEEKNDEASATAPAMKAILSGVGCRHHVLHLYAPGMDKYAIQSPFMAMAREGEEVVYVTEDPKAAWTGFGPMGSSLTVIRPWELGCLDNPDGRRMRVVVDAGSIQGDPMRQEELLNAISADSPVLCTYDISRLEPEAIESLVALHDKLVLTTHDVTLLSSGSLEDLEVPDALVERFVKEYLDMVVLAFLVSKPMCGVDIIDEIHRSFNVLLSPGTIYPLLHELEGKGLLSCEYRVKKKVYSPAEGREPVIHTILSEHLQANAHLSRFLRSTGLEPAGERGAAR